MSKKIQWENHSPRKHNMIGVACGAIYKKMHARKKKAGHTAICAHKDCGKEFHQFIAGNKLKIYCSVYCGDAARRIKRNEERKAKAQCATDEPKQSKAEDRRKVATDASLEAASVMNLWGLR